MFRAIVALWPVFITLGVPVTHQLTIHKIGSRVRRRREMKNPTLDVGVKIK